MPDIPFHPLAEIFPLIEGQHFRALVEDIREYGLREPIVLFEGQVLDGRNRFRACHAAQVDARFETFTGDDPVAFVCSKNIQRRHLDASQLGMAAARLGRLGWGGDRSKTSTEVLPREARADLMGVGRATVERADAVLEKAAAELIAAVDKGLVAVSAAADALVLPIEDQRRVAARIEAGKKNAVSTAIKQLKRRQRENELAREQRDLPDKKFGVILADPEWEFEVWGEESGNGRAAANHYPTSGTDAICARPVASIAAEDCVLFLWATAPKLPDAMRVLEAWGFRYVTHAIWAKDRIGTGYWFRSKHEILLIGKRGNPPKPADGTQFDSVFTAAVGEHSAKPDWQYELIESYFPNLPKIELNARRARPGWDSWGYEAPEAEISPEGTPHAAVTGEVIEDDGLDIPAGLRRAPAQQAAE